MSEPTRRRSPARRPAGRGSSGGGQPRSGQSRGHQSDAAPTPDAQSGAGVAARVVAADALVRIEQDEAFANLALDAILLRSGLDERDRRLVTELVYGCLRRRRSLDFLVDRFVSSDPPLAARVALRLGAYQIHFTDIPVHAAVSATVSAAPKRFRGLVNAVLRQVSTAPVVWPDEPTRLSYPDWLVNRLVADLGAADALDALAVMNDSPDVSTRDDGYVQDVASQLVAAAVDAQPGELIVDLCAAPGGKATALAASGARVIAGDLRAHRVGLIAQNAARTGHVDHLSVLAADALHPPLRAGVADAVLVDAPCSGIGVLHRRADARWRLQPDAVDRLAALQANILNAAWPLVKPGGRLVYSVCTLTAAESSEQAARFHAAHPEAVVVPPLGNPWQPWGSGSMLLPQAIGSDGMCVFRWTKPVDRASSDQFSSDQFSEDA